MLLLAVFCVFVGSYWTSACPEKESGRSFTIGYNENTFLKDGQTFRYVSGSMHYFRLPQQYWEDRLLKMKAAGLNAVQTYVEWNSHEREAGKYDFTGDLDLIQFIETAQRVGLYVIIRPGPYIDAERDMGGLPYWLMTMNKTVKLRSMDPNYLKYVDRWFNILLPMLQPLLYANGGPIIMMQVENEYGSYYACDRDYVAYLYGTLRRYLGLDIVLFTTDGGGINYLKCGPTDGAYATVDFGSGTNVSQAFSVMRTKEIAGPLVNSEYYSGWLDHWKYPHANVGDEQVAKTLDEILAANASVSIYMFFGGTSFGFTSGSNLDGDSFDSCPTSYDYDAPINEAGDLTTKYFALKTVIEKYMPISDLNVAVLSPKMKFGPVRFTEGYELLDYVRKHSPLVQSMHPLSFEELNQGYGFVLYETNFVLGKSNATITVEGISDRGYVYIDENLIGILSRGDKKYTVTSGPVKANQTLSIFVENQGRICFGTNINDQKGILGDVLLNGEVIENWSMFPIPLINYPRQSDVQSGRFTYDRLSADVNMDRGIFRSTFVIPDGIQTADTFLKLDGWGKGVAWLNGFNLGRYWPGAGPQVTLYVPGVWFKPSPFDNELVLLEQENSPCTLKPELCTVMFVDVPIINGTTI